MNRHKYQTATQWGVYRVTVEDARVVGVEGHAADPHPGEMGQVLLDAATHPTRVKRPAIRRGWLDDPSRARAQRGRDEFVDVPWDEALDMAAAELTRVIERYGNTALFAGSYGWASAGRFHHAQSQLHRFTNLIGGSTRAIGTYSTGAAQAILPHVVERWDVMELQQTTWQDIASGAELVVAFGGMPMRNTQVAYGGITEHASRDGLQQALQQGVELVTISPVGEDTSKTVRTHWLAPRPGTDVALMLGCAYVLEEEGLVDEEFLRRYTVGYDRFRDYLVGHSDGVPKTVSWAAQICDVTAQEITDLARRMAARRTFLTAAWSLQRAQYGEQPYWMLITLACMLGQIGREGCGFGFGYAAEGFVGSAWRRFHWATFPKGRNPTGTHIPVARITDMLMQPGESYAFNGANHTYPDIHAIYWAGGNPFHHHQDLHRLIAAWRRVDTVIVNEPWWTPTAQWADIVFPATTALERRDMCASSHDPYAHVMEQAMTPQREARSDHEIFKGLSQRMGVGDEFDQGRDEMAWLRDMWDRSQQGAQRQGFALPSFDDFWEAKTYRIPEDEPRPGWLSAFRRDPENNRLNTPSGKLEIYSETIAAFDYPDCPGHPAWMEPLERLGVGHKYPLHLLSPQPARRLHSQLDQSAYSQAGKQDGREIITMHPDAAQARGLQAGDVVRVFNDRGACLAGLRLSEDLRPDVVVLPTGAWLRLDEDEQLELNGNPNVLTPDIGSSCLGQAVSANTCLVEVEKYVG